MGRISSNFFIALDGVVEAPETWHMSYVNDEMGAIIGAAARRGALRQRPGAIRPRAQAGRAALTASQPTPSLLGLKRRWSQSTRLQDSDRSRP